MMPEVCIIIVNWNGKDLVLKALESVFRINYENYEVLIVDNASTDGSVDAMRENFPGVNILVNKKNLGGTGGFNTGIRHALTTGSYKYLWLLDNDAIVEKEALFHLVKVMEKDDRVGIAGSKILQQENPGIIWEVGVRMDWKRAGRILMDHNQPDAPWRNEVYEVDHVAACSLLARTSAVAEVGLMDEDFFWIFDDIDWCLSFKEKGYKVVAVSKSKIWHPNFVEKTRGIISRRDYFDTRNGLLLAAKHLHGIQKIRCFYRLLSWFFRRIIFYRLENNIYAYNLLRSAIRDFLQKKFGPLADTKDTLFIEQDANLECPGCGINIQELNPQKILIYPSISASEARSALRLLRRIVPRAEIDILTTESTKHAFRDCRPDKLISFPGSGRSKIRKLLDLRKNGYNLGIMAPNAYLDINMADKAVIHKNGQFYELQKDKLLVEIVKLGFSVILGEIGAFLLLPFCLKNFRARKV
jgi:GT2 family glycosyltransferase